MARCAYLLQNQSYMETIACAHVASEILEKRGWGILVLHAQLMKAIACNRVERHEEAAALFEEIYSWIHENNLVMLVIEYGSDTAALVEAYREVGGGTIPDEWLSMIEKKARAYQSYI